MGLKNNKGRGAVEVMYAIEAYGLTKNFGRVVAVNHVSFNVKKGEIFGFLGPNGAGKTTTVGMLTTTIKPTSGYAKVCGFDIIDEKEEVRRRITLCPQEEALDYLMTVYENLYFYAWLQGLPKHERRARVEKAIQEFELIEKRNARVITLSGGLARRVQLARVFLTDAEILFLDEPTIGLDAISRVKAWSMVREVAKRRGATVFLSTNDLHEAEVLCERIGFINKGMLVTVDTPEKLKNLAGRTIVKLTCKDELPRALDLSSIPGVEDFSMMGNVINVTVPNVGDSLLCILTFLKEVGIRVEDVQFKKPELEDVFINLVRRG